ncbi:MAG TPA: ABC transporter substrate-binding protein [Jiangellales bacterium]|nr:ABC transporter substrate-binding protein [Jiangellales bacterium]
MIRPTPLWRMVAVAGAASLVLAACGGDDGDDTAATDTASPTSEETEEAAAAEGDGTLTIGTLLPETGNLAFLGPPEFAGVQLAVNEINEAGGVLDNEVAKFDSDSGDATTDIASQSVQRLLGENVDAIIGAASSGVSFNVIDTITNAGVVQMSPANTSPDFTDYDDGGFYFRTAPSDVLQGRVLGDLILNDGNATLGILAIDDPYGSGLAENTTTAFEDGGGEIVADLSYNPQAPNFSAEVGEIVAAAPDAIALIAFDETTRIIPELETQGFDLSKVYFVDGNLADYSADGLPSLEGAKGTLPGAQASEEFRQRLLEVDPALTEFSYAAESYDAAILIALAAHQAGDDSGTAISENLVSVSSDGTACTTFQECKDLIDAGEDIDYNGVSGPIEFSEQGDPTVATIGIYQYNADNTFAFLEELQGEV